MRCHPLCCDNSDINIKFYKYITKTTYCKYKCTTQYKCILFTNELGLELGLSCDFQQYRSFIVEAIFFCENHRPGASHWQILWHNYLSSTPWAGFELTALVVIGTDCTCSCKSNYHAITTMTTPILKEYRQHTYIVGKYIDY